MLDGAASVRYVRLSDDSAPPFPGRLSISAERDSCLNGPRLPVVVDRGMFLIHDGINSGRSGATYRHWAATDLDG
jgi:hypothetical protein